MDENHNTGSNVFAWYWFIMVFHKTLTDVGIRLIIILPFLDHSSKPSGFIFGDSCIMAMISGWRRILRLSLYLANLLKLIHLKRSFAIHNLNRTKKSDLMISEPVYQTAKNLSSAFYYRGCLAEICRHLARETGTC